MAEKLEIVLLGDLKKPLLLSFLRILPMKCFCVNDFYLDSLFLSLYFSFTNRVNELVSRLLMKKELFLAVLLKL